MLPEIGTIEIADCLVYDPDSVEDYVAKLQATIADLRAKLGERDCQLNQKLNRSKHDPYKIRCSFDHNGAVTDFVAKDIEFETIEAARLYIKKQFDDTITNFENANTSYTVSCIANKDSIDIPLGYQQDYESVFYKKLFTNDFTMIMEVISAKRA